MFAPPHSGGGAFLVSRPSRGEHFESRGEHFEIKIGACSTPTVGGSISGCPAQDGWEWGGLSDRSQNARV